ncbi:MAG: hypothetical protein H8D45_30985 [Bacteroidetes bacterium]|nr:hypothetical protein [Bacteroidota bacterium]
MALIKTTDEIKQYLKIDANFNPESIFPFLPMAETEIIRILGQAQYDELDTYYNGPGSGVAELDALLIEVQRPLAWFAFLKGLDNLNVVITNNGLAIVSNPNLAPASKQRRDDLVQNISDNAWDNMEALLEFLEENIDDYSLWESSDAYAYQYRFLISSARLFNELYSMDRSRITFLKWRPIMSDVELLQMEPVVSKELMDELKTQIKADNVSANNLKILEKLQKALAYLTVGDQVDLKYNVKGEHYLMMVKTIIDTTPDDYPTYKASSVYDETITSYEVYENTEDSKLFIM